MNSKFPGIFSASRVIGKFAILTLLILAAGCRTPKIDWNARIGNYTYDQAVMDFGPPDKEARLDNGVVVSEWLTQRGYSQGFVTPAFYPGYYGPYYGPVFGTVMETSSPNAYLRLIFAPDHKLQGWKTFYR